jgi:hypothetical protein
MSPGIFTKVLCASMFFVIIYFPGFSQVAEKRIFRLVFYNTENFFDTRDDSAKQDNDFLPRGVMRWNSERYKKKINSIYKVLIASGEWDAPALAGFCEVENKNVLSDLISTTYLSKYNYSIVHEESEDPRGIDVCLIYRKELIKLIDYQYLKPREISSSDFRTRRVLYSRMLIDCDTVHLFLNHWPSKRGGVLAEEGLRETIAGMVISSADSVIRISKGKAKIIIAGDFNCTPDELAQFRTFKNNGALLINDSGDLINLSLPVSEKTLGSYKYQGRWELLDQVIVTGSFLKDDNGLRVRSGSFKIFSPDFLLEKDPSFPGFIPYPTYKGYKYHGGFSDHLPVLLDLYSQ